MIRKWLFKLRLGLGVAPLLAIAPQSSAWAQTPSQPIRTCTYSHEVGDPLGMQVSLSALEQDGNTTFWLDEHPTFVGGEGLVTIASRRSLVFYGVGADQARQLMLRNPAYYSALMGDSNSPGFAAVNAVLVCQTVTATPTTSASTGTSPESAPLTVPQPATPNPAPPQQQTPSPTPQRPTIASLSDGNYRYWNGQPTSPIMTDEALLNAGGTVFLFHKQGNQVTGSFAYIDGEAACIIGHVDGNTVAGFAYPANGDITNTGNTFTSWGPSGFLQVRHGRQRGRHPRYNSALLNLNGFSRINAGESAPPSSCP